MSKTTPSRLVFKTDLISPVHGSFRPGDVGVNVDKSWGDGLVAAGHAEWHESEKDAKAAGEKFTRAAGRVVFGDPDVSTPSKGGTFKTDDLAAQVAAGAVTAPAGKSAASAPVADTAAARAAAAPAPDSSKPESVKAVDAPKVAKAPKATAKAAKSAKAAK